MRHGKHFSYQKLGERPISDVVCPISNPSPANKTAAALLRGGAHYEVLPHAHDKKGLTTDVSSKIVSQKHWINPPKIKSVPRNVPDVTGKKFGRFTVIGYLSPATGRGTLWLVRCTCGRYESRRMKSINNQENHFDCCERCRHLLFMKRESYYKSTGCDIPLAEF